MTTRPGAATVGRNAPLALLVLTKATRCDGSLPRSLAQSAAVRSGPGRLSRLRAVEAAVADQQDDDGVARLDARGQLRERLLDAVFRGRAIREHGDVRVGDRVLFLRGVDERRRPLRELLRMLLVAGDAGNHQQVRLLTEDGLAAQHAAKNSDHGMQPRSTQRAQNILFLHVPVCSTRAKRNELLCVLRVLCGCFAHARPRMRRYPHSAAMKPTSARKRGMSHSSRSSTPGMPVITSRCVC